MIFFIVFDFANYIKYQKAIWKFIIYNHFWYFIFIIVILWNYIKYQKNIWKYMEKLADIIHYLNFLKVESILIVM